MDKVAVLRRIDALEQLLHDLRNDVLTDDTPKAEVEIPRQGAWSRRMIEELYPQVEALAGVVALLDLAAERAPQSVTYRDVLHHSGLSDRDQRNDHVRLSRTSRRLFGRKTWPLECQQASDGEMWYRMPSKVADWWRSIRSS